MKTRTHIVMIAAFVLVVSRTAGRSVENPSIRNPAGFSTVPPSSLGGRTVVSSDPLGRSSYLMGTGAVRRGRHSGSPMPYRSTTSLGSDLGSASLDSFLRDSAGPEDFGRPSGTFRRLPYYSWSKTVATSPPGRSGVFTPSNSSRGRRVSDVHALESPSEEATLSGQYYSTNGMAMRSTPLTPQEIGRLTSGENSVRQRNETLSAEQYRRQIGQLRLNPLETRTRMGGMTGDARAEKENLLRLLPEPGPNRAGSGRSLDLHPVDTRELLRRIEGAKRSQTNTEAPDGQITSARDKINEATGLNAGTDMTSVDDLLRQYGQNLPVTAAEPEDDTAPGTSKANIDRLAEQIASLRTKGTSLAASESLEGGADGALLSSLGAEAIDKSTLRANSYSTLVAPELPGVNASLDAFPRRRPDVVRSNSYKDVEEGDSGSASEVDKILNLSDTEVASRAERIIAPYGSHKAYSEAQFRQAMNEAHTLMKQGRYYQATNAYSKASVLDSTKPEAVAGRSLALFGAGEYISSALYLSRAIEASEEYARSKIDLVTALGDKDKLAGRIKDAEEWLERSCASELEFLLAYMYYRTGKLEEAKQAIATAEKEMPKSKAVATLKKVIDSATEPPKEK